MSFNFQIGYPSGIQASNAQVKALNLQAVKLTFADFSTGGTAAVKAALPADASIVGIKQWVMTQLSGGGITAATLSIGVNGTPTKFLNAQSVLGAAGTSGNFTAGLGGLFASYDPTVPTGDIQLVFTGTATTGNPTAGEIYILIEYVR